MTDTTKPRLLELAHQQLRVSRFQMREVFDEEKLQELASSIASSGLLQPIVVRMVADNCYEIVAGERRWRACKLAGLEQVPCLLNSYSDAQVAAAATIENVNRIDLNPIEEATAYKRLVDEFAYMHEEVASIVGKSRSKITNSLRLLKLDPELQQALITGKLSQGHAKYFSSLTHAQQREIASRCIDEQWSVRQLQQALASSSGKEGAKTQAQDPNLKRLSEKLSLHMGCSVQVAYNEKHTKLAIDCHNLEVLEGVFKKMNFDSSDI